MASTTARELLDLVAPPSFTSDGQGDAHDLPALGVSSRSQRCVHHAQCLTVPAPIGAVVCRCNVSHWRSTPRAPGDLATRNSLGRDDDPRCDHGATRSRDAASRGARLCPSHAADAVDLVASPSRTSVGRSGARDRARQQTSRPVRSRCWRRTRRRVACWCLPLRHHPVVLRRSRRGRRA